MALNIPGHHSRFQLIQPGLQSSLGGSKTATEGSKTAIDGSKTAIEGNATAIETLKCGLNVGKLCLHNSVCASQAATMRDLLAHSGQRLGHRVEVWLVRH